ncbi:MAG: oxygen-dependent coproporphyrinogen oxidase [Chitinophagaceae bacterium]|nr:oxygen-dependent coproporphyrinogen oxidase [Chitinophagaceae bacterium]
MNEKDKWIEIIHELQDSICHSLEAVDGKAVFHEDSWQREEGGGGKTRIISNGNVFEKGGVNSSIVFGDVTETMRKQLQIEGSKWFACGLSIVIHPLNPFVPTIHCNYRMFELYNDRDEVIDRWFGGGTDLTPYYLFQEDAIHFHGIYKAICEKFDPAFYNQFKKNCDDYFVNWHRNSERRGIGGIFYDHQRPTNEKDGDFWMRFAKSCGDGFISAYIPIVEKRKAASFTEHNRYWQEIRRGRYVEFNLVHDRGTLFGLKTNGRIESILMSLPPTVRFDYNYQPLPGSEEEKLLDVLLHPKEWAGIITEADKNEWAKQSNTC